jgi:hypothetical protein
MFASVKNMFAQHSKQSSPIIFHTTKSTIKKQNCRSARGLRPGDVAGVEGKGKVVSVLN